MEFVEVEANDAAELATVQKNEELRFYACVKVHLHQGSLIAVYADVLELLEELGSVFVILLDLGDDGIPLSCEVQQCESRSLLIKVLDHLIEVLRHLFHTTQTFLEIFSINKWNIL